MPVETLPSNKDLSLHQGKGIVMEKACQYAREVVEVDKRVSNPGNLWKET